MRRRHSIVLSVVVIALPASNFFLAVAAPRMDAVPWVSPKGYICHRAAGPIRVDGRLDDEDWRSAPWSDDFVDIEGDKRPRPRHKTRVKMLWDDQALYIAAQLEEPHVQASLTKHDSYIFHEDNDFEVFLDPDGDNHFYAELEMNALNTTWDLLLTRPYRDGGLAIDAWEIAGLRTAVHVDGTLNDPRDTDRGWTVEIAWPWRGLQPLAHTKMPPMDGDQWRINFSRVQWKFDVVAGKYLKNSAKRGDKYVVPEDNWVWSPQHAINMHLPEHWGYLQFSTAAPGTASFRPDPAGPAKHALHRIHDAQREYRKQHMRWATTMRALGLNELRIPDAGPPRLEATPRLYEASVDLPVGGGQRVTWTINSDGLIRKR